jgi:hypothetical protein
VNEIPRGTGSKGRPSRSKEGQRYADARLVLVARIVTSGHVCIWGETYRVRRLRRLSQSCELLHVNVQPHEGLLRLLKD